MAIQDLSNISFDGLNQGINQGLDKIKDNFNQINQPNFIQNFSPVKFDPSAAEKGANSVFDIANQIPLFSLTNFVWGIALIFASIIFSILSWGILKQLFIKGSKLKAAVFWLINFVLFLLGVWEIIRAFPRFNPAIVAVVLVFAFLILAGGGAIAKQKAGEGGEKGKEEKPDSKK